MHTDVITFILLSQQCQTYSLTIMLHWFIRAHYNLEFKFIESITLTSINLIIFNTIRHVIIQNGNIDS